MKILLLPDKLDNWSCHNRAKRLKENLSDYHVRIESGEDLYHNHEEIRTLFPQFDIVHFLYSSNIHQWKKELERLHNGPILVGSAIGHRWHACGNDEDELPETLETIATMRMMKHLVVLSPDLEKRCRESGLSNITYIPNGVDRKIFPYKRKLVVGHVGTNDETPVGDYKGGDFVRSACKLLGFEYTRPGCYGPRRGQYSPGQRSQETMVDWYKTIDVLCQPSAGEGCSNPIIEALSMNIRVVCTKEAVIDELRPYVTLCERNIDDICLKLDTSPLIHSWDYIASQYRRLYETLYTS